MNRTHSIPNQYQGVNLQETIGIEITYIYIQGIPKEFAFGNLAQFSPSEVFDQSKHRLLRTCLAHVPNANVFTLVYEL